jgi:hypothetical protein
MALDSYSNLKASIADWIARDDLTTQIDDFIDLFEAEFNRRLKTQEMRLTTTVTTSSTTNLVTLPADFRKLVNISFQSDPRDIDFSTEKLLKIQKAGAANQASRPQVVAMAAPSSSGAPLSLQFGPNPDSAYVLDVDYYASLPSLSTSTTTNWLLSDQPGAYLYGTLKHAGLFIKDSETRAEIQAEYDRLLVDMAIDNEAKKAGGQGFRVITANGGP